MSVGVQANPSSTDQSLTSLALQLRDVMEKLKNLNTQVNGAGNGLAYLEGIGYAPADATEAEQLVGYFNNLQGVYYGTATVAADFDFDSALAVLWGGSVS